MISLRLQTGETIGIRSGEIELQWVNNLFTGNSIPGVLSYPFEIDTTPTTLAALRYPAYLHSRNIIVNEEYPAYLRTGFYTGIHEEVELLYNGAPLMAGILKIKGFKNRSITGVFSGNAGNFSQVAKRMMKDLSYGGNRTVSAANLTAFAAHMDAANTTPNDIPYRFPTLRDEYGELVGQPDFPGYVNMYMVGSPSAGPGNWDFLHYPAICPFPQFSYIAQQLFIENGWSINSPEFLSSDYAKALLLYSPYYKRESTYAATPVINLADHVPNPFTIGEFINGFVNYFRLGINFSSNKKVVSIRPSSALLDLAQYDDLTSKSKSINNIEYLEPQGDTFQQSEDDADYYEPLPEFEYIEGNGERKLITSFGFLPDKIAIPTHYTTAFKLKTPVVKQSYDIYGSIGERTRFTPRLMFWRGYANRESPYPGTYPFATASDTDLNEDLIAASGTVYTEKLNWADSNGVVEQWHRPWINFLNKTRIANHQLHLNFNDLLDFDITRPKLIDGAFFFVSKMNVRIGRTISPAEVELYKIQ
jgi:hypothetical protein